MRWLMCSHHFAGPGLATADDCDDREEVSRVRLRYPKLLMSAHAQSHWHTHSLYHTQSDAWIAIQPETASEKLVSQGYRHSKHFVKPLRETLVFTAVVLMREGLGEMR